MDLDLNLGRIEEAAPLSPERLTVLTRAPAFQLCTRIPPGASAEPKLGGDFSRAGYWLLR